MSAVGLVTAALLLSASPSPRPTLAVLPPQGSQADIAWAGWSIADSLTTRLLVHSRLDPTTLERVYPLNVFGWRQTLSALSSEGLKPISTLSDGELKRLQRALGSDAVFVGRYIVKKKILTLSWRLFPKMGPQRTRWKITDMAVGVEKVFAAVVRSLGHNPNRLEGHKLRSLPADALKPYGEALGLLSQQSLDPRAYLRLPTETVQAAHARLMRATDVAPQFVRAWVERGIASAMAGETQRAEQELVQAMAQAGEFEPSISLGLYYLYGRQEKLDDGVKILDEAVNTHLGFLHGLGYLGQAHLRQAHSHHALEVFTQYLARAPRSPWARLMRAQALSNIGNHDLAISEAQAVTQAHTRSAVAAMALASRQIDAARYAEASRTLTRALAIHPRNPGLLTRLSYVELQTGSPQKALKMAERAVHYLGQNRGEPLVGYVHLNHAHALARVGQTEEAYQVLKQAVAMGVDAEARLMLLRDLRLKDFLNNPRSAINPLTEHPR